MVPSPKRLGLVAVLLLLISCTDSEPPTAPGDVSSSGEDGPTAAQASDSAHVAPTPPIHFLPPLAEEVAKEADEEGDDETDLPGTFDPDLEPVVEICAWTGKECRRPVLARFTTDGKGSERVRVSEEGAEGADEDEPGHYIVNWHTKRFDLEESETYRIRVLEDGREVGYHDVRVVSKQGGASSDSSVATVKNGRTLPIKFYIQKVRRLFVVHGSGVSGVPAERDTLYAYGAEVDYAFRARAGYENLQVFLDGELAGDSGRIVMDTSHVLIAGADETLELHPDDKPLVESARAILTASDKPAAFRRHLDLIGELYGEVGQEEASRRMRVVEALAYDLVEDSAAIRRAHEALANHTFRVAAATSAPDSTRMGAMAAREAEAERTLSEYWAVNGVLNTPTDAGTYAFGVERIVDDKELGNEVTLFYNSTWQYQDGEKRRIGVCFSELAKIGHLWDIVTWPFRLVGCMDLTLAEFTAKFAGDFVEAQFQMANLYNDFPVGAAKDARILSDTLEVVFERSDNMTVVLHSQGNLMMQEAMSIRKEEDPNLRHTPERCTGVVSLAAPMSEPWPAVDPDLLRGIVQKNDIILALHQNDFQPVDTDLTREAEEELRDLADKWWVKVNPLVGSVVLGVSYLGWRGKIHLASNYLNSHRGAGTVVRDALVGTQERLNDRPECNPVAAVEVSPDTVSVDAGNVVQLNATAVDERGEEIPYAEFYWTSSNGRVAEVTSRGELQALAVGPATIAASSGGESATVNVTVTGGGYLTGRVVDGETGAPISQAVITFTDSSNNSWDASTADDGSFTSPGLAPGLYSVRVESSVHWPVEYKGTEIEAYQTIDFGEIPMEPRTVEDTSSIQTHRRVIP